MSPRNPTFIVSNGKGSSYLFRTIIPQDLRDKFQNQEEKLNNSKEIRISLLTGLKSEAKRLAQLLKYQVDRIFDDIRSGNNSITCVIKIKGELKAHLYQIRAGGNNGERVLNGSPILPKNKDFKYFHQPMERKLIEDYISRFKYQDIIDFCEDHDIDYNKEADFPIKHIRRVRQVLIKKIGFDIGYRELAKELAKDILISHLSNMDFDGFKGFFDLYRIDDTEILDIFDPLGDKSIEQLVSFLEEDNDIISIARKIGVQCLFTPVEHDDENSEIKSKPERLEQLWKSLKSDGKKLTDTQILTDENTSGGKSGKVKKLSAVIEEYISEMKTTGAWNPKSGLEKRASLSTLLEIIEDIPITDLSFETGRKYKQTLMKLPANRNKIKLYRDLTIEQIIKMDEVNPMSVRTVNNNVASVIAFMNWAKKHGYIKDNYFEGLKLASIKNAQEERKPFDDTDLKKIFNPKVYREAAAGIDFRYWVPIIGLYTGARLNEICQLQVEDIKQEDGLWCMHITVKGGDEHHPKKLKNKASERLIPLHEKLIELDFIILSTG